MECGKVTVCGFPVVYQWKRGSGMEAVDYQAAAEGLAIRVLNRLRPNGRVIHESILWNKNRYRLWVREADQHMAFARKLMGGFFSRTTQRGRRYRQAMKRM